MTGELPVKVARRAAARMLIAHRAGVFALSQDGEHLCVDACQQPSLKRVLRVKIGTMWLVHGPRCPSPGAPGGPRHPDERDEELAAALEAG